MGHGKIDIVGDGSLKDTLVLHTLARIIPQQRVQPVTLRPPSLDQRKTEQL